MSEQLHGFQLFKRRAANLALTSASSYGSFESIKHTLKLLAATLRRNSSVALLPIAANTLLWGASAAIGWQGVKNGPDRLKLSYILLKILEPVAWAIAPLAGLLTSLAGFGVTASGMRYRK